MDIQLDSPKQRQWRRRGLLVGLLILVLPTVTFFVYGMLRTPGVMMTSENYMDRPIFSFWVNDFWGGNLAVMGGGGIMCCRRIDGSTAKVVWILGRTGDQVSQGLKKERYEIEMPLPSRNRSDRYLHVRFDPGNKVRLGWSPDLYSPFEVRPKKVTSSRQGGQP